MQRGVMNRRQLGEILVRAGLLTQAHLDALNAPPAHGGSQRLAVALLEHGVMTDRELARALSQELSVPLVALTQAEPPRATRALVPREIAERFCLAPVYVRRDVGAPPTLFVAIDDPTWEEALFTVSIFAGMAVRPLVAPRSEIRAAIARWYAGRALDDRTTIPATAMNENDLEELTALDARLTAN